MNVFAGRNGSGKTTLLEASAVILGAYLRAFSTYVPARHAFNISEKDAHLKTLISRGNSIMTTGGYSAMVRQIVRTVQNGGFFSVWMTVFADEPDILLALIHAFPGTENAFYDAEGHPKMLLTKPVPATPV